MTQRPNKLHQAVGISAITLCVCFALGCARDRYQFGLGKSARQSSMCGSPTAPSQSLMENHNPLAVGGEHPTVDKIEAALQAPRRWLRKVFRRTEPAPSEIEAERAEAIALVQAYLQANGMEDVYIDVRRYEPGEQWQRLKNNDRVAPLWKATGGTLSFVSYILLPRRALRSDDYNPYTNTLSLNSSRAASAIYEASDAKQFRKQPWLGTYAMLQNIPFVPLYHHSLVTSDVLTYARVTEQAELEQLLIPMTYSNLGGTIVSETLSVTPIAAGQAFFVPPLMTVSGRVVGAVTGHVILQQNEQLPVVD